MAALLEPSWLQLLQIDANYNTLAAGQLLASAGVAGEMFLWKPSTETQKSFGSEESDAGWRSSAVLRLGVSYPVICQYGLSRQMFVLLPGTLRQAAKLESASLTNLCVSEAMQVMCKTLLGHQIHLHSCLVL